MGKANSGDTGRKVSPVEEFKAASDHLRGEIAAELYDGTDHFGKGSIQLLKHHGIYQQDDRDARAAARKSGGKSGKALQLHGADEDPGRQVDGRAARRGA